MSDFSFTIHKKDKISLARAGEIVTPHGIINTPAFVPVGTKATVKGLTPQDLRECGVELLFGNTYNLNLRPGEDIVAKFGGLAKFMSWNGPTITDSGGYQISFLWQSEKNRKLKIQDQSEEVGGILKITDEGAFFRSHIDGSGHVLTPEKSI